ncbi:MAG: hypothetical protein J6D09_09080 [Clostridia bacterium]|nr:hypothetical protein [Clostridia bacterium]
MKKRILSFLVACVMVVSTFIISKPLVHVHAVESETTFVEGENQWTMPTNWHEASTEDANGWVLPVMGQWSLQGYTNLDTADKKVAASTQTPEEYRAWKAENPKANNHGVLPAPYIAVNANEAATQNSDSVNYGATGWYCNWGQRWGGLVFRSGDVDGSIRNVCLNGKPSAVVFTAPEDGTYSFTETLVGLIDPTKATVTATVRKNGEVLATFNPTALNESKVLSGEVMLAKGDVLMFAFQQDTTVAIAESDNCFRISDVVVKRIGDYTENTGVGATWELPTDFYTCNPGAGEKINGHWQLATYDTQTQTTYYAFQAAGASHTASGWYFDCTQPYPGQCGSFAYNTRGFETNPGHANNTQMASAIIFTAPADGVYEFDVDTFSYGWKVAKNGSRAVIFYVMKDGVIYDITNPKYNADNTENMTGTITLKKGETIYFCAQRYTHYTQISGDTKDWPAWIGARYEGLSVEKVAELTEGYDFVTKYTFAPDGTALADGQFEMKAYDFTNNTVSGATLTAGEDWYVSATSGNKLFWNTDTANAVAGWGPDGNTANANEGAAIVFTAPADGTYNVTGHFLKNYMKDANGTFYCDYRIILEDGTVVFNGTNYDESQSASFSKLYSTFGGSVELSKGEKVYIVKSPNANVTATGAQGAELYSLTVAQIGDVCEGNHTFVDGVCTVCDYECANHAWKNEDGACTVCGATHTHEGGEANCTTGAICDICKYVYTDVVADNHDWNAETGTCTHCGTGCEHDWMDGVCKTCGYECQHTGGTATCATRAMCEICDSYYGDTVADNHEREGKWVDDVDGCYLYYGCCYTSEPVQPHEYDDDADMTCNHCGYDRTVEVKEEDFAGVFEDVYGEGESDVVAEAPEENAFDNYAAVAGSKVDAYLGFNLELVGANADYVYLRHHILYNGGEVLVDGNEVALNKVSGNYYYFDVAVAIGDFDKAHVVTIDGDTIVTASVYSYMKTAYGSGTLNAEQTNLLNALYQWDKAVADATYNG